MKYTWTLYGLGKVEFNGSRKVAKRIRRKQAQWPDFKGMSRIKLTPAAKWIRHLQALEKMVENGTYVGVDPFQP